MREIQEKFIETLNRTAERLGEAGLPVGPPTEMKRLVGHVGERCVVVVAQVKAGKSTFVNALLDGDLAKIGAEVGTTETTATVNYFSYGKPPDPDRPVRYHWRGAMTTYEDQAFLDSLQGNKLETLRRADGLESLECLLEYPFLEQLTLVDTPGTNAVERLRKRRDRSVELSVACHRRTHGLGAVGRHESRWRTSLQRRCRQQNQGLKFEHLEHARCPSGTPERGRCHRHKLRRTTPCQRRIGPYDQGLAQAASAGAPAGTRHTSSPAKLVEVTLKATPSQ